MKLRNTSARLKTAAFSLAAAAAFAALMPEIKIAPLPEKEAEPFVSLSADAGADAAKIGAEQLNDFAPMFIPTYWNCAPAKAEIPKTSTWEPQTEFSETQTEKIKILAEETPAGARKKGIKIFMREAFASFGAQDAQMPAYDGSVLFELKDMRTGKTALSKTYSKNEFSGAVNVAEFLVRVCAGTMQTPLLKTSSGSDEADAKFKNIILQSRPLLPDGDFIAVFVP